MSCVERLLSKFNYYYYGHQVVSINIRVEKVGDYILVIDNLTKNAKIILNKPECSDLKSENNN